MTEGSYHIIDDPSAGILRVTAEGFWSLEKHEELLVALRRSVEEIQRRGKVVRILFDASTMQAQSPELGRRSMEVWPSFLTEKTARAAIVVQSALATMQFRRVFENERCRVFGAIAAAEAWLRGEAGR